MRRTTLFFGALVLTGAAAACGGGGGERNLPASPVAPGDANDAALTAPTIDSPSDDQLLTTIRPTLTVNNATSSGNGSRSYEFQVSDVSGFASTAGAATGSATISLSGIPEGSGKTSFTPPADLLPATRYYWRARAIQGASIGPWSSTSRFRTKVASFKSGNSAFDILTDGLTVADSAVGMAIADDGGKTADERAYLMYRLTALPEGEVSFNAWRVKPGNNGKIFTMQDGTGSFNSNPYRAFVQKSGSRVTFNFAGNQVSATYNFLDNTDYYFKIEWRAGSARLRIYRARNDAGGTVVNLSVSYPAPYGAANPVVTMGSRNGDTMRDVRYRRLYIGPNPRPVG